MGSFQGFYSRSGEVHLFANQFVARNDRFASWGFAIRAGIMLACATTPIQSLATGFELQTVALTGDPVYGRSGDETYIGFSTPTILQSGAVSFGGSFAGNTVDPSNDTGTWLWTASHTNWLAREGDLAPGTTIPYRSMNVSRNVLLANSGNLLMSSTLTGGVSALHFGEPGNLDLIALSGTNSGSGVDFTGIGEAVFTANGNLAFTSQLDAPAASNEAVFAGTPSAYAPIVREGDPALSAGTGLTYGGIARVSISSQGDTVFTAGLNGPNVDQFNDAGIFLSSGTASELVAREGAQAIGVTGGVYASLGQQPGINSSGHYVFESTISNAPGIRGGIWTGQNGSSAKRVVEGDAAEGFDEFVSFSQHFSKPLINDQQTVAFLADLTGLGITQQNNDSLWISTPTGNQLVAREGDSIPGFPNVQIKEFVNYDLNNQDQVAFQVDLSDGTSALLLFDPNEPELIKVARESELLLVGDPGFRVINTLSFAPAGSLAGSGGSDGRHTALNHHGELAFSAIFTDGSSGVFVATVPEPSAFLACCFSTGLALALRRRQL